MLQKKNEYCLQKMFNGKDNPDPADIEQAQIQIRMLIRLGELQYRDNQFKSAHAHYDQLQTIIFQYFLKNKNYLTMLMMSLTENTVLELHRSFKLSTDIAELYEKEKVESFRKKEMGKVTGEFRLLRDLPEAADEFLYLICQIALCLGKTLIRRSAFRSGEKSLGDALKAIELWRKLRLARLESYDEKEKTSKTFENEVKFINNYTLYKSALTQVYLGFTAYRKGNFTQAQNLVTPARLILHKSNWLGPKIFADLIYSGGNRRLAGINNKYLLEEVSLINQQIIHFFDPPNSPTTKKRNPFRRDFTFKLRAIYEQGIYYYYSAELLERAVWDNLQAQENPNATKMIHQIEDISENIFDKLAMAEQYAGDIKNHFKDLDTQDAEYHNFWLANAAHLFSFVEMKRAVLKMKLAEFKEELSGQTRKTIENHFNLAEQHIEAAQEFSEKANSWWQRIEIQTDTAFILNEFSRFWTFQIKFDKTESDYQKALRDKDKDGFKDLAILRMEIQNRSKQMRFNLINKALQSIETAEKFAITMAKAEIEITAKAHSKFEDLPKPKNVKPRSHFAGPISLVKSESFALCGQKKKAEECFDDWKEVAYKVEYTRVRDLSSRIEKEIKNIPIAFILSPDIDCDLNYKKQELELKRWQFANARMGRTERDAMDLLNIPHATFYKWRNEIDEINEK